MNKDNADYTIVWSDTEGDLRKSKKQGPRPQIPSTESLVLKIRRLTNGKGRTVIEITSLPLDEAWCKSLASELKKQMGCGGTYKQGKIEIHGEQIEKLTKFLNVKGIAWKQIGGQLPR